jgi:hypothetical protein
MDKKGDDRKDTSGSKKTEAATADIEAILRFGLQSRKTTGEPSEPCDSGAIVWLLVRSREQRRRSIHTQAGLYKR